MDIRKAYAILRTPEIYRKHGIAPQRGVEEFSHTGRRADVEGIFLPGIRKRRVPLAKVLAPLRGALSFTLRSIIAGA